MFKFRPEFDRLPGAPIALEITERFSGEGVLIPFYYYDMVEAATGERVGKISIRIGDNFHSYYNGHIGYEVFPPFRGRGYALAACRLVLPVARAHGMTRLYLTCDENNLVSAHIIERLGGQLVEVCVPPKTFFAWREDMGPMRIYRLPL